MPADNSAAACFPIRGTHIPSMSQNIGRYGWYDAYVASLARHAMFPPTPKFLKSSTSPLNEGYAPPVRDCGGSVKLGADDAGDELVVLTPNAKSICCALANVATSRQPAVNPNSSNFFKEVLHAME